MSPYLIFALFTLCDLTNDVTLVLVGRDRFSSISSDRSEMEGRKRHHCYAVGLPNRLTSSLTPYLNPWPEGCGLTLTSGSTLALTLKETVHLPNM